MTDTEVLQEIKTFTNFYGHIGEVGKAKIYRPGDPEFNKLAALYGGGKMGLLSKVYPRLDQELGTETALQVVAIITEEAGGFLEYVETTLSGDTQTRNRQIIAEFDGRNYQTLARKFNLSDRRIRQITGQK